MLFWTKLQSVTVKLLLRVVHLDTTTCGLWGKRLAKRKEQQLQERASTDVTGIPLSEESDT